MTPRARPSRRTAALSGLTLLWLVLSAVPALADNCGTPADCFGQVGSFNLAALGLLGLAAGSLLLDFVPVVGTAKGVVEAILGRDLLTGEKLSWWERGLGVLPVVGGVAAIAGVARAADRAADLGGAAGDVRRAADAVGDVPPPRAPRAPHPAPHPGLDDYTGPGYDTINRYLRGQGGYTADEATALQSRADRVSQELARLPPVPGTTYRGTYLSAEQAARYEPGRVVTERAFTSTSTDPQVAEQFTDNAYFIVRGQSGRDVAPFSQLGHESEILYDQGTRFRVITKTWDADLGRWLITLREVPA
jgi:hypothetical protein